MAERVEQAFDALRVGGATIVDVEVPAFTYGLTAYYIIAPAEASSNLARYDGVRYGLRVDAADTNAMYAATRTAGFGAEVRRRILLGTYALSAGYYDAYYGKALRIRRLMANDFAEAYEQADVLLTPTSPSVAFPFGVEDRQPARHVPVRHVHDPVQPHRRPGDERAVRHRRRRPAGRCAGPRPRAGRTRHAAGRRRARASSGANAMSQSWTHDGWEMVVGLEVHVELATATKLFSASPNRFGDEPNTNIDPVTLGLPGALPVLNRHAVELAMTIGLALNCSVQPCTFARKNYFYPDMPKAYQISQYDQPLNVDGWLDLPDGTRIGIERAHMEEDAGKSIHAGGDGRVHQADYSLIDLNRAGVPLVEIVSRPDLRSPEQARQYVTELRAILLAVEASDARMEEGSMRVDANVSVRRPGEPLGTRCEIKNVNSVRSVGRAIEYEAKRQIQMLEAGEPIRQQTRHWDEGDSRTHTLARQGGRGRLPLLPRARPRARGAERRVGRARSGPSLPMLPAARRTRLAELSGLATDSESVVVDRRARPRRLRASPRRPRAPTRSGRSCTCSRTSTTTASPRCRRRPSQR